jgi:hypothetical protein
MEATEATPTPSPSLASNEHLSRDLRERRVGHDVAVEIV